MADLLNIAVLQLNSQDDASSNLTTISTLMDRMGAGVRAVFLPEGCAMLADPDSKRRGAEQTPTLGEPPMEGPVLQHLASLAKQHDTYLFAGGIALRSDDPKRPFNAHVAFDPRGNVAAVYRKIHLFDVDLPDGSTYRESDSSAAGDPVHDLVTVDVDGFRLGLTICYDVRFPEIYRKLVDLGADVLLVPAAFTVPTGKDHWHVLLRARAIESSCYVIAAAQFGRHPQNRQTYGKSLVADPWGDVIAQASDGVGVFRTTLERSRLDEVRRQLPSLRHRRVG